MEVHYFLTCPLLVVPCKLAQFGCSYAGPQKDLAAHESEQALAHVQVLIKSKESVDGKFKQLSTTYQQLQSEHLQLQASQQRLQSEHKELKSKHVQLQQRYEAATKLKTDVQQ